MDPQRVWGPFLERPGNFSGLKANFKIKTWLNLLNISTVPSSQTGQFCSLTDNFILSFSKLLKL